MKFFFEEAQIWKNRKHQIFQKINKMNLPLVIYGRGEMVNFEFIKDITAPVEYVCSSTPASWGTEWRGKQVVGPRELPEIYSKYNVLIPIVNYTQEITDILLQLSTPPENIFSLDFRMDDEMSVPYLHAHKQEAENVYDHLTDDCSKETYEMMLRYRINRELSYLQDSLIFPDDQYFPRTLGNHPFLGDNESFIDVGAYTGDTVRSFYNATQGKYSSIYAFEPDKNNFEKLLNSKKDFQNLNCFQCGIGEQKGELRFVSKSMGSHVDANGKNIVPIETLDDLFSQIPVSLIKMDIEGMECPALRGAEQIIKRYRPKLAICIYHSASDMIEVPKLILKINPQYHLFIRQHAYHICDTVCYAV